MAHQLQFCSLGNHGKTALDEVKASMSNLERNLSEKVRKLRELKKRCRSISQEEI